MNHRLRILHVTIEVNLLLWLAAFGVVMSSNGEMIKPLVILGFIFAVLAQHWAYYAVRRMARDKTTT
jgi:hypothetical protein